MDLTAIVLCGEGKHLHPIASVRSGVPKALLPVANQPLMSYGLEWIEKLFFSKIIVVAQGSRGDDIRKYVEEQYEKKSETAIEVFQTDNQYSGEIIASLASKVSGDFVVLPCDFITGDVDPQEVLKLYYNRDQERALISGVYYRNNIDTIEKKALSIDYLVHTPLSGKDPKLLDVYSKEWVQDHKGLELRTSMMWRYPNGVVSTNILDASIYLCSHKVLDLFNVAAATDDENDDSREDQSVSVLNKSWSQVVRDVARRSWRHKSQCEEVWMHVLDSAKTTFIRANNLSSYLEANRYIMKQHASQIGRAGGASGKVGGSGSVGSDSLVGTETVLGQRTTVKRTVVGNNCTIGSKCRITGCVILDGVNIQDDVVLENCLIGKKANIGTRAKLTGCNVEGGYQVLTGFQTKNETLQNVNIEGFIEEATPSEDEEETEEESDDGSEEDDIEEDWNDDDADFSGDDLFER
jgi:translation initiation factor eIF-2B subunit gamma